MKPKPKRPVVWRLEWSNGQGPYGLRLKDCPGHVTYEQREALRCHVGYDSLYDRPGPIADRIPGWTHYCRPSNEIFGCPTPQALTTWFDNDWMRAACATGMRVQAYAPLKAGIGRSGKQVAFPKAGAQLCFPYVEEALPPILQTLCLGIS